MRANVVPVPVKTAGTLYDTAGTGGDGKHTFNISTAAAFVIAGAGRKVAKHGNRAASSQCGSADVLGALGVNLDLTPEQVGQAIDEVGIGFLFAPKFHPAMKHAGGPRKEIGQRTIFNVLGPLTNPAGAEVQIIGVFDPELTEPLAQVLGELGSRAAFVVHGAGGMDELNTVGPNRVSHLKDGKVTTTTLDPEMLDLPRGDMADLVGGTPEDNAQDSARRVEWIAERHAQECGAAQCGGGAGGGDRVICAKASPWPSNRWSRARRWRNWMSWWSLVQAVS